MTDFVFYDKTGKASDNWPPIRAAAVDALSKSHQMEKYGRETFGVGVNKDTNRAQAQNTTLKRS